MKLRFLLFMLIVALLPARAAGQVKLIDYLALQQRISNIDTVYIVNFWATWCGPCVKELPNFDKLQRTYNDKPLKVLLVSMDFQSVLKTAVIPFARSHKLFSEVYLVARKSDQALIDDVDKDWSGALPATLLVNTKRGIRRFYEKSLTYDELNNIYQANK